MFFDALKLAREKSRCPILRSQKKKPAQGGSVHNFKQEATAAGDG